MPISIYLVAYDMFINFVILVSEESYFLLLSDIKRKWENLIINLFLMSDAISLRILDALKSWQTKEMLKRTTILSNWFIHNIEWFRFYASVEITCGKYKTFEIDSEKKTI